MRKGGGSPHASTLTLNNRLPMTLAPRRGVDHVENLGVGVGLAIEASSREAGRRPHPAVLDAFVWIARRRQARDVTEFADDAGRRHRPDAVVAHQLPAARLAARQRSDVALKRGPAGGRARRSWPAPPLRSRAAPGSSSADRNARPRTQQLVGQAADAVVEQRRLNASKPAGALVDKGPSQPGAGAPLAHVGGRYPGLG